MMANSEGHHGNGRGGHGDDQAWFSPSPSKTRVYLVLQYTVPQQEGDSQMESKL